MATSKNFIVKNGLIVGGQEVVSSSGVVTSAALGGQTLASTDSPTFANLTVSNDLAVSGDLNLTGDLNITGDVNTLSVTDLDVTDQTITLGAGQVESASGGSGIIVDGSLASILWDETNDTFDFNKGIDVTGNVKSTAFYVGANTPLNELLYLSGSGHNGHGTTNTRSVASFNQTGQSAGIWIGARNDETTGIIGTRTATGNLAFETYNSGWGERMRITYDGNIGIGTGNPVNLLHVSENTTATSWGSYPVIQIDNPNAAGYAALAFTQGSTASDIKFRIEADNSNDRLIIAEGGGGLDGIVLDGATGNIGIGAAPLYKLDLGDTGGRKIALYRNGSSATEMNSQGFGVDLGGNAYSSSWWFPEGTSNNGRAEILSWDGTNYNAIFTVNANDRVGIGTNDPDSTLHVDATGGGTIRVTRLGVSASAYGRLEHDGTNTSLISSASLIFSSNATERMRIDQSGNIQIKTTTNAPVNSVSLPPYLEFRGQGWDSNSGSDDMNAKIEMDATYGKVGSGATSPELVFSLQGAGGLDSSSESYVEAMRIVGAGAYNSNRPRVGIGTALPSSILQIGDGTTSEYITIDKSATGESGILFKNASNNKGKILLNSSEALKFYINNTTDAMTINESSDVTGGTTTIPGVQIGNLSHGWGNLVVTADDNSYDGGITIAAASTSGGTAGYGALFWKQGGINVANTKWFMGFTNSTSGGAAYDDLLLGAYNLNTGYSKGGRSDGVMHFDRSNGNVEVAKQIRQVGAPGFKAYSTSVSKNSVWQLISSGILSTATYGYNKGGWSSSTGTFNPQVEGYYLFTFGGWAGANSDGSRYATCFGKNGLNLQFITGGDYCNTDSPLNGHSEIIYLNGSTDYVDLYAYSSVNTTWGGSSHYVWWGAEFLH